jgi:FkbM family methyltransferase
MATKNTYFVIKVLNRLFEPFGYRVMSTHFANMVAQNVKSNARKTMHGALSHLHSLGLEPASVIDVGIADGTPDLYAIYPTLPYLLIEPLQEYVPTITKMMSHYPNMQLIQAAADAESGWKEINVNQSLHSTSFFEEEGVQTVSRQVKVVTLDEVVVTHQLPAPYLIKADVEGAELNVLEGASQIIHDTNCVILEANLFSFRKGAPLLNDIVDYMDDHNFTIYDIVNFTYRPIDNALARVDIIFVPDNHPIRQDTRFASDEQRKLIHKDFVRNFNKKLW